MARTLLAAKGALDNADMLAVEVIASVVPYLREQTEYLRCAELEELAQRVCHSVESVPTKQQRQAFASKKYQLRKAGIL